MLGIRDGSVKQQLVETEEEVTECAERFIEENRNVYFGVAKFATDAGRTKDNVKALRAFWLDIDCGAEKGKIDPDTGRAGGYVDQETAMAELRAFVRTVGLPKPTIVDSGRGLHVYWVLDKDVTREEWEPVAKRLSEVCVAQKFFVDPAVFEVSRVLRIPGTPNFKDDPPNIVNVIVNAPAVSFESFRDTLGVKAFVPLPPKRELSALGKKFQDNIQYSFNRIMKRSTTGKGCKQLADGYKNRVTLSEPRWFDALSVAKFCSDKDAAIHKFSAGHPDYDAAQTEQKIKHIVGPHNCATFEKNNPGGCEGCLFKGKIKNPILLGKEILEDTGAEEDYESDGGEDEEQEELMEGIRRSSKPVYPEPFFGGANGGIYRRPIDDEGEPILVYEHKFSILSRMMDPKYGEVVLMELHLPLDTVRVFTTPLSDLGHPDRCRTALSKYGMVCGGTNRFKLIKEYVDTCLKEIQYIQKAEDMRLQFGWADKDTKFILGDREITPTGTFHSPPSSVTKQLAEYMRPKGSIDLWRDVFNLYNRPGLEPHAFAALTAFGSPLFRFTGHSGALINLIHSQSGTGKTTILHMINSVYGDPKRLCLTKSDTYNAKLQKIGVLNNLCPTIDEITNMLANEFSETIYSISQGRGKDRMTGSENELRHNATTWQCISVSSANASFNEKLLSKKGKPDGEMMRLLEYKISPSDAIDVELGKKMFDKQLLENFGHAGPVYLSWVVANLPEVIQTLNDTQQKIDKELNLSQRERFWSAVLAANITGGRIAKRLGLMDWDLSRVYLWAAAMLEDMRKDVTAPYSDSTAVVGDYLNRNIQNLLVINGSVDRRTGMKVQPVREPKGELLLRYEPDTKELFIAVGAFKKDCADTQINYKETTNELKSKGILKRVKNERLSKGMAITTLPVHCLVLDAGHVDFLSMDDIATSADEASDESGGS